jgi:hypothetical protein
MLALERPPATAAHAGGVHAVVRGGVERRVISSAASSMRPAWTCAKAPFFVQIATLRVGDAPGYSDETLSLKGSPAAPRP